jgi:ADP-dependent NAD(P)H-hydrate dehydratase
MTNDDLIMGLPAPRLPALEPRSVEAHKGDFGNALLIGGSRGMSGAIAMAGLAAIRAGAGLVRLAVPDRCLETVASFSPCAMTIPLADNDSGQVGLHAWHSLEPRLASATCVAVGPGLGQSRDLRALVCQFVEHASSPLVIDADGLNNLAGTPNWTTKVRAPLIITPHPGEWSRLCGVPAGDRPAQVEAAIHFARSFNLVVVLKGYRTLVTDGKTAVLNTTGTPAMATGGSGDVLTGLITALVCQGLAPRDAAHLGVYAHGLAAQLAEQRLSSHVVLPTELIDFLPAALARA